MPSAIARPAAVQPIAPERTVIRTIAVPAAAAANHGPADYPIDPQYVVYEERLRTMRLLARAIRRAVAWLKAQPLIAR